MKTTVNIFRAEQPAAEQLGPAGTEPDSLAPSLQGAMGENPIFNLQSLWDIAGDTGGPALALQFLHDFFSLQQARLSRLLTALAAEDPTASADAVRSLYTASSMAGATHIAARCGSILPLVLARNFAPAHAQAAVLQRDVGALTAVSPMLMEHAEALLLGAQATAPA